MSLIIFINVLYIHYDFYMDFSTSTGHYGPVDLHFGPKIDEYLDIFVKYGASR